MMKHNITIRFAGNKHLRRLAKFHIHRFTRHLALWPMECFTQLPSPSYKAW
jgi:hypothetical protein